MSDICKCDGNGCDKIKECYRTIATDGMMQSWFLTPPLKDNDCDYFIPNERYESLDRPKER